MAKHGCHCFVRQSESIGIFGRIMFMFRQEETFVGGWQDKTIEAMQRRRFQQLTAQLPPLGAERLEALPPAAFARRLEQCWQDVLRKPMRTQQLSKVWQSVLDTLPMQADCLSHEEHELVERALILGGSAQIEDAQELEAARALSLRLWASVGMISGRPYIELEPPVLRPAAKAFSRAEHQKIRSRFESFRVHLDALLYCRGAVDDRLPQRTIVRDVLQTDESDECAMQLARQYLWAGCDCMDYSGGVLLLHHALADPQSLMAGGRRRSGVFLTDLSDLSVQIDILPEEVPLQRALERAVSGALREGQQAQSVARSIRFLCKQGAPLAAMEEVLQETLVVLITPAMRRALAEMYFGIPKWIECRTLQSAQ